MTVSIFYLCRHQDVDILQGTERFLTSYLRFPDSIPHKLYIGLKGWDDPIEVHTLVRRLGVECEFLTLPDKGFDWTSYFAFSSIANTQYVCFLNSHSEILAKGWLERLMSGVTEGACLVGNTASLSKIHRLPKPNFHLMKCPWVLFYILFTRWFRGKRFDHDPVEGHIRSNAFLIERRLFNEFAQSRFCPVTKAGAHELESGPLGLTSFVIREKGGVAVLVNDSDRVFQQPDWFDAQTFRVKQQKKLLVADNQTRYYERLRWYRKCILTFISWRRL
jgi:hypothetical protein